MSDILVITGDSFIEFRDAIKRAHPNYPKFKYKSEFTFKKKGVLSVLVGISTQDFCELYFIMLLNAINSGKFTVAGDDEFIFVLDLPVVNEFYRRMGELHVPYQIVQSVARHIILFYDLFTVCTGKIGQHDYIVDVTGMYGNKPAVPVPRKNVVTMRDYKKDGPKNVRAIILENTEIMAHATIQELIDFIGRSPKHYVCLQFEDDTLGFGRGLLLFEWIFYHYRYTHYELLTKYCTRYSTCELIAFDACDSWQFIYKTIVEKMSKKAASGGCK